ncbi:MAG: hypothetical protein QF464_01465 [Myxococcota bacterium]|jgi:hypothetical protein|nr:hypothetical protein [Myxococcota bacterium]
MNSPSLSITFATLLMVTSCGEQGAEPPSDAGTLADTTPNGTLDTLVDVAPYDGEAQGASDAPVGGSTGMDDVNILDALDGGDSSDSTMALDDIDDPDTPTGSVTDADVVVELDAIALVDTEVWSELDVTFTPDDVPWDADTQDDADSPMTGDIDAAGETPQDADGTPPDGDGAVGQEDALGQDAGESQGCAPSTPCPWESGCRPATAYLVVHVRDVWAQVLSSVTLSWWEAESAWWEQSA